MSPSPTVLILFDLDGTLMSTGGAGLKALERTFQELYGIRHLMSAINPSGKTDPAIFREVIREYLKRDTKKDEMDTIADCYLRELQIGMSGAVHAKVMPGVETVLDVLQAKPHLLVGLGTGNLERGARLKLDPVGLNPRFSFGGFGSDAEDRALVLQIGHQRAEKSRNDKIPHERTFIVGDTPRDVQAARRAGFKSIAVATGRYAVTDLIAEDPDFVFKDLNESLNFMGSL